MLLLRPGCERQRDRQHGEPYERESRDRQNEIADKAAQRTEMLSPQRKAPLQQKQRNENAGKQRLAGIIHQRNLGK